MTTVGAVFSAPRSAHSTPSPLRWALRRKLCDLSQPSQSSIPLESWLINDSAVSFRQIARYCNQSVASDRPVIKAAKQSKPLAHADLQKRTDNNCTQPGRPCARRLAASEVGETRLTNGWRDGCGQQAAFLSEPSICTKLFQFLFQYASELNTFSFFCSSFITHQEEWKKQRKWKNIIWQFS